MQARLPLLAITLLAIAGCGGNKVKGDGPPAGGARPAKLPGDAIPRKEPRSKYGNPLTYEVLGKRYSVMPSSAGYQQRGVASWYGKKFHGRLTSNREVYDMYKMTAAHKTLPLPTYVRVRNLRNGKSVVVRVNDRGPFVHNRIIDLSYAAAYKLDMIRDGTSMVEVTAISFDEPECGSPPCGRPREHASADNSATNRPQGALPQQTRPKEIFVQVGAFGERANAERRLGALSLAGIGNAFIHEEQADGRSLYRVRIGPIADVVQYDVLVEELESIGIADPYLITE